MSDTAPTVLLVITDSAPMDALAPAAAALEATGANVVTADLGNLEGGALKVVQALLGESEVRRLEREMEEHRPACAVAFDAGAAAALIEVRDRRLRRAPSAARSDAAPVVAVVPHLSPGRQWALDADRFAVIDDEAAVALQEQGVDGARVLVTGVCVSRLRLDAGHRPRAEARAAFGLGESGPVALVDTRGLDHETLGNLLVQLALFGDGLPILFDAARDADVASLLRGRVPALGLKAKMFGETASSHLLWRAADIVLARPGPGAILRALAAGAAFVALEPEGGDEASEARGLAERGIGQVADRVLLLAAALDPLVKDEELRARATSAAEARSVSDGAALVSEITLQVARERVAVLEETLQFRRERAAEGERKKEAERTEKRRSAAPPADLEDLSAGAGGAAAQAPRGPDSEALDRLRREIETAEARARKELEEARSDAERWEERRALAEGQGDARLAAEAAREADRKRARMHSALHELSRLATEKQRLAEAPKSRTSRKIDDMLGDLKKSARAQARTIDEELAELKRRMAEKKPT